MLRESQKFSEYNFRCYALRRVHDAFKKGQKEADKQKVQELIKKAEDNLAMIKRQTVIGNLYKENPFVMEGSPK